MSREFHNCLFQFSTHHFEVTSRYTISNDKNFKLLIYEIENLIVRCIHDNHPYHNNGLISSSFDVFVCHNRPMSSTSNEFLKISNTLQIVVYHLVSIDTSSFINSSIFHQSTFTKHNIKNPSNHIFFYCLSPFNFISVAFNPLLPQSFQPTPLTVA